MLRRLLRTAAGLLLLLAGWWFWLAPTSLGGPCTYVLIAGSSMQPLLSHGDLVAASRASSYAVGDLVVLRVTDLGRTGLVIHRLVARSGDGWVTRGDNNAYLDPWVVSDAQILGRMWFSLPRVGLVLFWMRGNPLLFGSVCALLTLAMYLPLPARSVSLSNRRRSLDR